MSINSMLSKTRHKRDIDRLLDSIEYDMGMSHHCYEMDEDQLLSSIDEDGKSLRFKRPEVWSKTEGRCYLCGCSLSILPPIDQTMEHIIAQCKGGGNHNDNLWPACRSCNSGKNHRTIEEYRFSVMMKGFHLVNGVRFSPSQYNWLKDNGLNIGLEHHEFWFEKVGIRIQEHTREKTRE